MGLVTTTVNQYGYRVGSDTGTVPGDPPKPPLTRMVIGQTITELLAPEHRVMPPDPLGLSPTSRVKQSTVVYKYYSHTYGYTPANYTGPAGVSSTNATTYFYHPWPTQPILPEDGWIVPLRNKIKDMDISLGETVFEFRETAHMFHRAAVAVGEFVRFVRAARKGNLSSAKKRVDRWLSTLTLGDVADAHLGAQLGIAPLLQVAADSYFQLTDVLNTPDFFVLKKFVVKVKNEAETSYTDQWGSYTRTGTSKYRNRQRAVVYVKFTPGKTAGFTMGNPLEVGWELVPFSFVLDWFIPVGEFLKSLDALESVVGVPVGTVSTHIWGDREVSIPTKYWSAPRNGIPTNHSCVLNSSQRSISHSWRRDLISGIPAPPFPRWRPSESWKKLSIAVALFIQARRGLRDFRPR